MRHRHTKSCKHTKRVGGRKHTKRVGKKRVGTKRVGGRKHHHTKNCKHTRGQKRNMMKGGVSSYPSSYSLGVKQPVSNFEFNPSLYGSNVIPTSMGMTGGRRVRKHRGGIGYSFLPPGSDVSAKDSYLANVAPYSVYNE